MEEKRTFLKIVRKGDKITSLIFDDTYEIKSNDGKVWNAHFKGVEMKEYPEYLNQRVIKKMIKAVYGKTSSI